MVDPSGFDYTYAGHTSQFLISRVFYHRRSNVCGRFAVLLFFFFFLRRIQLFLFRHSFLMCNHPKWALGNRVNVLNAFQLVRCRKKRTTSPTFHPTERFPVFFFFCFLSCRRPSGGTRKNKLVNSRENICFLSVNVIVSRPISENAMYFHERLVSHTM